MERAIQRDRITENDTEGDRITESDRETKEIDTIINL